MSLLDEILDNHDRLLESADRENAYYGNDDAGLCYRCNETWNENEICSVCGTCPDCCECGK